MPASLEIACYANSYSGKASEGKPKVFVPYTGTALPRPITVKQNNKGLWRADAWSSLLVGGIRKPATTVSDDF